MADEVLKKRSVPDEHPDYWKLPEVLRGVYSEREYGWLTDCGRAKLLERECLPDYEGEP